MNARLQKTNEVSPRFRVFRRIQAEYLTQVTTIQMSIDGGETWKNVNGVVAYEVRSNRPNELGTNYLEVYWPIEFIDVKEDQS